MYLTLDNGLSLVLRENHAAPLVTADIWVKCGAAQETPALSGVSHFLEHMVFKGTERLAVGEYDRRIENLGGYLNAGTAQDFTHYYFTAPSRHFAAAFRDLADVVTAPLLDPEEFEKERDVILEEIRRKFDHPAGFLADTVLEETYREGPYKRSVLGSPETIRALTRDQMADYHAHHYRPGNLVAVVVGDVESDRAVDEVKECLGSISRPYGGATGSALPAADYAWGLHREYPRDTNEVYLMMTFPAPGIADTNNPVPYALELAATILGGSRSSRLWQSIREEHQLVSSIALNYLTLRGDSLIEVFATLEPRNLQPAIDAVWTVFGDFLREGPTAEELQRAKKSITNQYLFDNESNAGQASTLGYFTVLTGDPDHGEQYLKALAAVSAEKARAAAAEFLARATSNLFTVVPESAK